MARTSRKIAVFSEFRITYEREVATADVAEFADVLAPYCLVVRLTRLNHRVAAGGIGTLEGAVVFSIAVVAVGFLTELSRDIYKGATAALLNLYRRLRQLDTRSGRLEPLVVVVDSEHSQIRFVIPDNLSDSEFLSVFGTIAPVARDRVAQIEDTGPSVHRVIEYALSPDREWVERFNEVVGGPSEKNQ